MRGAFLVAALVIASPAIAANREVEIAKTFVEVAVKGAVNDPDSIIFDSMSIYRKPDGNTVGCGMLRGKNAYGGYIRQTYVVTGVGSMPVYIGKVPLTAFANDCSGEEIYRK